MDKSYKRIENIDEKIKEIKLTYNVWRTLFLVDENTTASQIADILEEEAETVAADLGVLEEAGLVSAIQAEEILEAAVEEEPAADEEPEPIPEEAAAELFEVEEEPESEAPKTEVIMEEDALPAEEPVIEEAPEEESVETTEPEILEEEPAVAEEEDIEINIHGEESSEDDLLDMDFSEAVSETTETEKSEEPVSVEETVPEPEPESSGRKSVLVIDDSIVIRKMVEIALENEDYLIHTAVSGKDGLDKIDNLNPSLIILDLMLPDINGIDILKTVKASRKTPVIMLSGKDSPQMVEKAKESGADAFLPKPFKDDELIEKINALI